MIEEIVKEPFAGFMLGVMKVNPVDFITSSEDKQGLEVLKVLVGIEEALGKATKEDLQRGLDFITVVEAYNGFEKKEEPKKHKSKFEQRLEEIRKQREENEKK